MKLKIAINGEERSLKQQILVDESMKLVDFLEKYVVAGPFLKDDECEIEYSISGNDETFSAMMRDTGINKEEFQKSVYFKKLSSKQLVEKSRKEASETFQAERKSKKEQLLTRIEDVKKIKDHVTKFTSLDDEFLKDFNEVKVNNGMKISDFAGINSKQEALDAITSLEKELTKYKSFTHHELDVNFNLENKCLSLLNSSAPSGIQFEGIDQPNIVYFTSLKTGSFYSKEHWKENSQSKFFRKNSLAGGGEADGGGFGGWGPVVAASSYRHKDGSADEINMGLEGTLEATQVVVSMQSTNQLIKFQAKCAILKPSAESTVRQLAKGSKTESKEKVRDFFKKYPEEINFGPFAVGGRFEIVGVTISNEKVSVSQLHTTASKRVSDDFKAAVSFGTLAATGSASNGVQKDSVEAKGRGFFTARSKIDFSTQIEKYCYGPEVTNEDDLSRILHIEPQTWSIFPTQDGSKHRFVPIYEVIESTAKQKGDDKELLDAAEILRKFLKEQELEQELEQESKKREDEAKKREKEAHETGNCCAFLSVWFSLSIYYPVAGSIF